MCLGDTALEGPDTDLKTGNRLLKGWAVEYQCKDWDGLSYWVGKSLEIWKR